MRAAIRPKSATPGAALSPTAESGTVCCKRSDEGFAAALAGSSRCSGRARPDGGETTTTPARPPAAHAPTPNTSGVHPPAARSPDSDALHQTVKQRLVGPAPHRLHLD